MALVQVFLCLYHFVLIWRAVHPQSTEAIEASSSRPKMQVMDPHGAGLVFRNYTRPSGPSGPPHSVHSPSVSLFLWLVNLRLGLM